MSVNFVWFSFLRISGSLRKAYRKKEIQNQGDREREKERERTGREWEREKDRTKYTLFSFAFRFFSFPFYFILLRYRFISSTFFEEGKVFVHSSAEMILSRSSTPTFCVQIITDATGQTDHAWQRNELFTTFALFHLKSFSSQHIRWVMLSMILYANIQKNNFTSFLSTWEIDS